MNLYTGSDFDDFLAEEGVLEVPSAVAQELQLAIQVEEVMTENPAAEFGLAD